MKRSFVFMAAFSAFLALSGAKGYCMEQTFEEGGDGSTQESQGDTPYSSALGDSAEDALDLYKPIFTHLHSRETWNIREESHLLHQKEQKKQKNIMTS